MENMEQLKAVLVDIDGTLVDSNDAHAHAWVDALTEAGYTAPFVRVRKLIGKGGDKVLPEMTGIAKDSAQGKRITARRTEIFKENYLPGLRPFPGARRLLERMHEEGLRIVAATSANEDEMKALLEVTGAPELFYQATSSGEAAHSKPDPDIVEAAITKAGCEAQQAFLLGDTPYDVEASVRASVRPVTLRSGGWSDDDLRGAIVIYDSAEDLLHHYEQSPLGQERR